jgi:hypothetical protein
MYKNMANPLKMCPIPKRGPDTGHIKDTGSINQSVHYKLRYTGTRTKFTQYESSTCFIILKLIVLHKYLSIKRKLRQDIDNKRKSKNYLT